MSKLTVVEHKEIILAFLRMAQDLNTVENLLTKEDEVVKVSEGRYSKRVTEVARIIGTTRQFLQDRLTKAWQDAQDWPAEDIETWREFLKGQGEVK